MEKKEVLELMKTSFLGNKKSKGFIYLTAILMMTGISFVLIGLNEYVNAKYKLVNKQAESFYKSIEENNSEIVEEK